MDESTKAVFKDGVPGWTRNGRFYPVMAGAEHPPTTPEATPAPTPAAAEPSPVAAPEPTGPWAQDLAATFEDPTIRTQVDEFLRGRVQPYVTGLESRAADLEKAASFVNDLQENPLETYVELSRLLGGEELADQVQTWLTPEEQAAVAEQAQTTGELDPRVQELIKEREDQKNLDAYEAQLADLDVDPDLFHPLVISHGTIEAAYAAYPAYIETLKKALGVEAPSPGEVPDPPSVLGSDTRAASTPPLEQKAASMDEAIDLFFATQRGPPQTVGSV